VQTDRFFAHLNKVKAIEQWNPEGGALTDAQSQFLLFWESVKELYYGLKDHLSKNRRAYKGMVSRAVAESIDEKIRDKPWRQIIFAGFNALSASEEKIFHNLIKNGKARVVWDMDKYYVQNEWHEAGHYIRQYLRKWRNQDPKWEKDFLASEKKEIHLIGVAKNVGQARVAGDIVHKLQSSLDQTAVVLADESLLFPMLHSLPESANGANVSMGLSLKFTPLFSMISSLFDLQQNVRRIETPDKNAAAKFYYRDIISILSHPIVQAIDARSEKRPFRKLIRHIYKNNFLFMSPQEIENFITEISPDYTNVFFHFWNDTQNAIERLLHVVTYITQGLIDSMPSGTGFETESLGYFDSILRQLDAIFREHDVPMDIWSFWKLLTDILTSARIPFTGEPLQGLQIMGVLETRTIDFENIIILSVNENVLPAPKIHTSMIPLDIKREFGLPTYKERDAIFSYNFYRSIQRAKNIYLIYNTETDEFGKGERSRFITQLLYELPKYNPTIASGNIIKESFLSFSASFEKNNIDSAIEIPKNPDVLRRIEQIFSAGVYPSPLKNFIQCPLRFYLKHVARLKLADDVDEKVEPSTFGSAIHLALKELFMPLLNQQLKEDDIDEIRPKSADFLHDAFLKFLPGADMDHGMNHLLFRVGAKLIGRFLDFEKIRIREYAKAGANIIINGLEKELSCELKLQLNGEEKSIKLKGVIDRIDMINGIATVIDYKTGKVQDKELKVDLMETIISDPALEKSFQILSYAYIFDKNAGNGKNVLSAAIYPFRKLSEGPKPLTINGSNKLTRDVFDEFEVQLRSLVIEIMDPSQSFKQTNDPNQCRNCDYVSLCHRN
jgi:hypothetical protein